MSAREELAKLGKLQLHDVYTINEELSVYRVPGGLLYITYKRELLETMKSIKEIQRVPVTSTFVPYTT